MTEVVIHASWSSVRFSLYYILGKYYNPSIKNSRLVIPSFYCERNSKLLVLAHETN